MLVHVKIPIWINGFCIAYAIADLKTNQECLSRVSRLATTVLITRTYSKVTPCYPPLCTVVIYIRHYLLSW